MKDPETTETHGPGRTRGKREVRAEGSPLNRQVLLPAERFIYGETISGALLLVCAIAALVWANSPWSQSYFALRDTPISLQIGDFSLALDLQHWINDGLMTIFSFVVELEIKRELLHGDLMAGLLAGKVAGVTGFAWLAVRLGWAALPGGVAWRHIVGAGLIGGVGFTVSLFITGLAFSESLLIEEAKVGVLAASFIAALGGYLFLLLMSRGSKSIEEKESGA